MFEHSLYEPEPIAPPLAEGDLFHNYEIKTWDLGSRIYKILGISAVANILVILVVGQTSLLTMKGCESPLVGRVCEVLDTVYVGTKLFGTDREWVDAVYEKTEIGDAEVTFVDVTGVTPPLSYPEGYFQIANPAEFQAMLDSANNPVPLTSIDDLAGFPVSPPTYNGGSLLDTKPNLPQPNNDVIDGDLPTFNNNSGVASNPPVQTRKGTRGGRVTVPGNTNTDPVKPDEDDTAGKDPKEPKQEEPAPTPMTTDAVAAVEINKKPLADFADDVSAKWTTKEIDLNQPFTVVMNGVLTKDGKIDREKSKFDVTKQQGDEKMIDVAKLAIEAVGDSGFLTYLKSLDVDKLTITLVQDDKQITAVISSAQKTPERAKVVSSGINGYIMFGKTLVEDPSDERTLLNGANVTSEGKNFILNFAIPKPVAQEMINRKLVEAQAKKNEKPQPNSVTNPKPAGNTTQH